MEHFKWLVYIILAGLFAAAVWYFVAYNRGCTASPEKAKVEISAAGNNVEMESAGSPVAESEVRP